MSTADLRAAVEGLGASPFYGPGDDEYMCENCVTPWKCNGPHVSEKREIVGYEIDRAAVLALIDQHHCDEGAEGPDFVFQCAVCRKPIPNDGTPATFATVNSLVHMECQSAAAEGVRVTPETLAEALHDTAHPHSCPDRARAKHGEAYQSQAAMLIARLEHREP